MRNISNATRLQTFVPGVLIALTVALASTFLSEHYGAPTMLMALLLGLAFNFLSEPGNPCSPGIEFASRSLLRIGVALLGLGISVQQILSAGSPVLFLTISGVVLTIVAAIAFTRVLGRKARFALLVGGAVAICGASAALAISSVLPKSEVLERDTAFTVIGVTALSTIAMIAYPVIGELLGFSDFAMGLFLGATIHDVAQVVGAGYSVSEEAGGTATFVKLLRVALLVPLVLIISYAFKSTSEADMKVSLPVPYFVLGFAALVLVGSVNLIPETIKEHLLEASRWCLVSAIAALGMKTSLIRLRGVGRSAIALLCALTVLLAGYSIILIYFDFLS